ncbi:MAG: hypothetical protein IJ422_02120 [Oscillospiraceae bacterium]|nr:hypothetical protein [Oscillospiraceae bacterium]
MKFAKNTALFSLGGAGYVGLELLWRGWSHYSMFLAGGSAFLLLGVLQRRGKAIPMPLRAAAGALAITAVELTAGLIFNRNYGVWDYRNLPMNFQGQICLPFTLLWYPLSAGAMVLYDRLDRRLPAK